MTSMPVSIFLFNEPRRLGVVDHDEIPVEAACLQVHLGVRPVGVEHALVYPDLLAVERVVESLRDLEERFAAFYHVPVCNKAQLLHQGHHPGENLGDASADSRGVDVLHHPAFEAVGEQTDFVRYLGADDFLI